MTSSVLDFSQTDKRSPANTTLFKGLSYNKWRHMEDVALAYIELMSTCSGPYSNGFQVGGYMTNAADNRQCTGKLNDSPHN